MYKLGIVMIMLGLSMGDSECLLVPLVVLASGMLMVWRGSNAR